MTLQPKEYEVFGTYTHQHSGWQIGLFDERGFGMMHGFSKFPFMNPVFQNQGEGMAMWNKCQEIVESVEWNENKVLYEKNVAVALANVGLPCPNNLGVVWESKKPVVEKV